MNNLKLLTLALIMLFAGSTAVTAQIKPESFIAQCPNTPPLAQLAAPYENEAAQSAIASFNAKIDALLKSVKEQQKRAEEAADAAANKDAERLVKQTTGRSVAELEKMSDAEQEKFVNEKMASAGLGNLSLSDLEAFGDKSEDEIIAAMTKGGVTIGGLTPAELKAMENMTDAQMAAYMQGDRGQRAQKAFATNAPQLKNQQSQAENFIDAAKKQEEMKQITDRFAEIRRSNSKETEAVAAKIAALRKKYQTLIDAVPQTGDGGETGAIHTKAEWAKVLAYQQEERTECYTLWRNHISKMQQITKPMMDDAKRYDKLMSEYMTGLGMTSTAEAAVLQSMQFAVAEEYLRITSSVTNLPK